MLNLFISQPLNLLYHSPLRQRPILSIARRVGMGAGFDSAPVVARGQGDGVDAVENALVVGGGAIGVGDSKGIGMARDYISKQILVKTLKGQLSEFEESLQRAVAQDDFDEWSSRMELAIVASQIRSYEQAVQLEAAMTGITNDPVGAIGDKVETDITVVKSVYSQNYGVYFITGVTADRRAVFFSYRERLANGHRCHVKGTVKAHRENSTQLNRVRIV